MAFSCGISSWYLMNLNESSDLFRCIKAFPRLVFHRACVRSFEVVASSSENICLSQLIEARRGWGRCGRDHGAIVTGRAAAPAGHWQSFTLTLHSSLPSSRRQQRHSSRHPSQPRSRAHYYIESTPVPMYQSACDRCILRCY